MIVQHIKRLSFLAFLTLAVGNLHAQVNAVVNFSAVAVVQNTGNPADNGLVTTTGAPTKFSINTKSLLVYLAQAEQIEGNWNSPTFPAGAKLVAVLTAGSGNLPDFQVVDKTNTLLVDVSDLLTGTASGTYGADIYSGKVSDDTGLAAPTFSDVIQFTLTYDSTGVAGAADLQFSIPASLPRRRPTGNRTPPPGPIKKPTRSRSFPLPVTAPTTAFPSWPRAKSPPPAARHSETSLPFVSR